MYKIGPWGRHGQPPTPRAVPPSITLLHLPLFRGFPDSRSKSGMVDVQDNESHIKVNRLKRLCDKEETPDFGQHNQVKV